MIVDANEFVYVSNAVPDLTDRWILETSFGVLTSVVEDTSLLVDVVKLQRLEVSTLTELDVLQTLNVNDQSVRLSLSDSLLNLEVSDLKHICKTNAAVDHRLRDHSPKVGCDSRVRHATL